MNKRLNKSKFVSLILHILGLLLCILPPMLCTVFYFPLWKQSGSEVLASGILVLLILCLLPLYKDIRRHLSSAASYVMWLLLFILFFSLSKIAEQMTVISFFGFSGNLLGAVCLKISRVKAEKGEKHE